MPRYQPAEPVLRSATTHSTVPFGVVVGYAPCDSNAAPYALSGGTTNGAGAKAGRGLAVADADDEGPRRTSTTASSSGGRTNRTRKARPIRVARITGVTRDTRTRSGPAFDAARPSTGAGVGPARAME